MAINTSLSGRLKNTALPNSHGLFPLFEAVVNAIQSVDETFNDRDDGRIEVRIRRQPERAPIPGLGRAPLEPIIGFTIRDNGEGFHSKNMASFETLDSEYKAREGCRGVGRLLWLKAFERVRVDSTFRDADTFWRRSFKFDPQDGITDEEVTPGPGPTYAEITLAGFKSSYQKIAPKMTDTIARSLLEHCLWYYVRPGGVCDIVVIDGTESINLQEMFTDYMRSSSAIETLEIRGIKFDIIHLKLTTQAKIKPHLNWCAANRVVIEEGLAGKVAGLYGPLRDEEGDFVYAGYLTSGFLNDHVRSERTDFDLLELAGEDPEDPGIPGLTVDRDLTMSEIRNAVLAHVGSYLKDSLSEALEEGRDRVENFS